MLACQRFSLSAFQLVSVSACQLLAFADRLTSRLAKPGGVLTG